LLAQTGRLSGLRIILLAAPSQAGYGVHILGESQWLQPENQDHQVATFVPEHSNGWFAMDSDHLSF
jgi:hypothetical protein